MDFWTTEEEKREWDYEPPDPWDDWEWDEEDEEEDDEPIPEIEEQREAVRARDLGSLRSWWAARELYGVECVKESRKLRRDPFRRDDRLKDEAIFRWLLEIREEAQAERDREKDRRGRSDSKLGSTDLMSRLAMEMYRFGVLQSMRDSPSLELLFGASARPSKSSLEPYGVPDFTEPSSDEVAKKRLELHLSGLSSEEVAAKHIDLFGLLDFAEPGKPFEPAEDQKAIIEAVEREKRDNG